jgi:hypothetical protein
MIQEAIQTGKRSGPCKAALASFKRFHVRKFRKLNGEIADLENRTDTESVELRTIRQGDLEKLKETYADALEVWDAL